MFLEAVNITEYSGPRLILEGVTFAVREGETVGFLGSRRSGKSSVMRLLAGYAEPTSGVVKVCGENPRVPAARAAFGYLPEGNPLPPDLRVGEYLRFRAGIKGLGRTAREAIADAAGKCRIGEEMDAVIGRLPAVVRLRVGLADCMLASPPILLLDDPVAGLEPRHNAEMAALIARLAENRTLVVAGGVLHDVSRLCRRALLFDAGRVVLDGDLAEMCERNVEERILRLEILASEPVREVFRILPGVRVVSVEPGPGEGEAVRVRITMSAGVDLRREVSALCAARGWAATDMRLEPVRLDDIFRRLDRG